MQYFLSLVVYHPPINETGWHLGVMNSSTVTLPFKISHSKGNLILQVTDAQLDIGYLGVT